MVLGVHAICGSQLFGHFELLGVHVNRKDASGTSHFGTLDHREPHGTQAKDGHGAAALHVERVPGGAQAGRNTTAQQRTHVQGCRIRNLGTGDVGHHGILREGGAAHEVLDLFPFCICKSAGAIWHHTATLGAPNLWAKVGALSSRWETEDAVRLAALRGVAGDDLVARLQPRDAFADALHHRTGFVAQDAGEEPFWVLARKRVDVGVTQGVGMHLQSHFPWTRGGDCDLLHPDVVHPASHGSLALDGLARCKVPRRVAGTLGQRKKLAKGRHGRCPPLRSKTAPRGKA
mmetsp:Transcript_31059/g.51217  ORF Transcript_31059/g.51217 Transcript_31059/m.51217 type:complete len:289 (-) Transcript_31059:49-915(-)